MLRTGQRAGAPRGDRLSQQAAMARGFGVAASTRVPCGPLAVSEQFLQHIWTRRRCQGAVEPTHEGGQMLAYIRIWTPPDLQAEHV